MMNGFIGVLGFIFISLLIKSTAESLFACASMLSFSFFSGLLMAGIVHNPEDPGLRFLIGYFLEGV